MKIISSDNKGLIVRPEECEMDFIIKKNQIAINAADARPSRFTGGERIDCAILDLDLDKRKANLSIKLLEELAEKTRLFQPMCGTEKLPRSGIRLHDPLIRFSPLTSGDSELDESNICIPKHMPMIFPPEEA